MKVCKRINFIQIIDNKGTTRICGWLKDGGIIGRLADQSMKEIYHGDKMHHYLNQLASGDYSNCRVDACPLLSNNEVNEHLIEINELPEYPEELYLAFEQTCNYRCTSCTVHDHLIAEQNNTKDIEADYEQIKKQLEEVLPHIKKISANGQGEVFASRHIMGILSSWTPIAPENECSVDIETNGSLFNETNWRRIENLGKYKFSLYVSVMSFDEKTYQYLSGTSMSIERVKENLKFIKDLRKKGLVNYLEIATVYQERNFRTLPDFVHEALKYDPDCVRLRPYEPWTKKDWELRWFADVRGRYHPYHQEWKEIMKDPIFKHPKVYDQGGGRDSESDDYPVSFMREQAERKCDILTRVILDEQFVNTIHNLIGTDSLVIYGLGNIAKALTGIFHDRIEISAIVDRYKCGSFNSVKVIKPDVAPEEIKQSAVLLTVMYEKSELEAYLRANGFVGSIFDIRDIEKK